MHNEINALKNKFINRNSGEKNRKFLNADSFRFKRHYNPTKYQMYPFYDKLAYGFRIARITDIRPELRLIISYITNMDKTETRIIEYKYLRFYITIMRKELHMNC